MTTLKKVSIQYLPNVYHLYHNPHPSQTNPHPKPQNHIKYPLPFPLPHLNSSSSTTQTPSCKTLYSGATPSQNGICTVVTGSSNDAVICPFALMSCVSAATIMPFAPAEKVAVWFVSGMVMTIFPERRSTYLVVRLKLIEFYFWDEMGERN